MRYYSGAVVVSCGLLSACASAVDPGSATIVPSPNPTHLVADGYDGRYRFSGMVFESSDHGPQLCGVVMQSYPPQCSGPDVGG